MSIQKQIAARRLLTLAISIVVAAALACHRAPSPLNPTDARFSAAAPDSFDAELTTTKGPIVVRVVRSWSPHGADRFYSLVRSGFFTDVAFHRTIRNFVAQFGISGDAGISRAWQGHNIPDDTVRVSNKRGTMTFARGGPNTRSTQLYLNLVDNTYLDTLNGYGFPTVGRIVEGLAVMDSLNWEYSGTRGVRPAPAGPSQDSIRLQGRAYLRRNFPRLDYIVRARVARAWR